MPGEYHAEPPNGGHHVWVTLNRALDERALYAEAARLRGGVHRRRRGDGGAADQTALRLSFALVEPGAVTRA